LAAPAPDAAILAALHLDLLLLLLQSSNAPIFQYPKPPAAPALP